MEVRSDHLCVDMLTCHMEIKGKMILRYLCYPFLKGRYRIYFSTNILMPRPIQHLLLKEILSYPGAGCMVQRDLL